MSDLAVFKQTILSPAALTAFRDANRVAGVDAVAIQRIVLGQVVKSKDLMACDPMSIVTAAMQGLQLGLLPDGHHGHLVPFKGRATFLADYKGLVQLAFRSGMIADFQHRAVYQQEVASGAFSIDYGRKPPIHHAPLMAGAPGDEDLAGAYASATIKGSDSPQVCWMNVDQLRAHKARYVKRESSLMTFTQWSLKTVVRQLIKMLPISAEWQMMIQRVDASDNGEPPVDAEFIDAEVIETEGTPE